MWLFVMVAGLCSGGAVRCQLPVIKGKSTTQSGMIYYDMNSAEDKRERVYSYTVCPDSAGCIYLDFNLIHSDQAMAKANEEPFAGAKFIRIYDGPGPAYPLIAELGNVLGSKFIHSNTGCITLEFTRDGKGLNSVWTAMWRGKIQAECIRPMEANPCTNVQDICGPEFHENFHYFGQQAHGPAPLAGTCVEEAHNATWYRFAVTQSGKLQFEIRPDNGFDDFDWVLVKADPKKPGDCPQLPEANARLACNNAAGRGQAGATGMDERGQSLTAGGAGNPYCHPLTVEKGDIFFLFIDDYSRHSSGFTIRFNDVVMNCGNPRKDFLQVAWNENLGAVPVDPRKSFTKYTRVLRIDLEEKANLPLAESVLPVNLYQPSGKTSSKLAGEVPHLCSDRGLVAALMNGLKLGTVEAYAAHDFQTPIHFGDLLELALRHQRDSSGGWSDWWNPPSAALENYMQVVEVIVDEWFDKNSGVKRQRIRYIRLLWTDRDGGSPDYNVAVFPYDNVRESLDKIPLENRHNDAQQLSIMDFLEGQMYQSLQVERSSKTITSLQQSKFAGAQQVELESFNWDR